MLRFSIKESNDSFLFEADYLFLIIMKNVEYIEIKMLTGH